MSNDESKALVRDWVDTVLNGRRFDEIPRFTANQVFGERVQGALGALPDLSVPSSSGAADGQGWR